MPYHYDHPEKKPLEIVNPPKQGTPTVCMSCKKNITPLETFGDLNAPLCWSCHASLFDKAQENYQP